jgi:hypothetical protein
MFDRCPKCGHAPLPPDQAAPAECPACGVILAKAGQRPVRAGAAGTRERTGSPAHQEMAADGLHELLLHVPDQVDATAWRARVALLAVLALWGLRLCWLDYREAEINASFLHGPLLLFHEAGHVVFGLFGEWVRVFGGTLGQLAMPALLCGALLWKNRDPFGAAIGLWFVGVSILDIAPYMYDALHPVMMLTTGATGEAGGHDWIYLFDSVNQLRHAQGIGGCTHALGVAVVLLAIAWAAGVLRLQRSRLGASVLLER